MLLGRETHRKRHDGLFLPAQALFQQGVPRFAEAQRAVLRQHRHAGDIVQCHVGLGHHEVQFAHETGALEELRHPGAQEFRKFVQDASDFPRFGKVEFGYFILQGHHFGRFHKGGLAGGAFVVHVALEGPFLGRCYRDEQLSVADGHGSVRIRESFLLRLPQDSVHPPGYIHFLVLDAAADAVQFIGSGVFHFPVPVQDAVDAVHYLCRGVHAGGQVLQVGVNPLLHRMEKMQGLAQRVQQRA